ncbi:hypothetical protein HanIR_Chr14g0702171 [Helianthus annuus]|nr:hypothetical protein HanIR_Chr14g0702171 [Helianthus annuus]
MFVKCLKRRYTHPPKKIGVGARARRLRCVSQQEIWNIERLSVVDAVKDNQIFQPHNATTVVTLVQRVGEEPVNVAV